MARHIDARVARRIDEQIADRHRDSSSLPPDADNLAGLIEMLLNQCIGPEDCAVEDACNGDLEVELTGGRCRPLGEEEVIASLHRQECYRRHRLLGKLLLNH